MPEVSRTEPTSDDAGEVSARLHWARLWRALSNPGRDQIIVGILLGLVGFGAVVQMRATEVDDTYAGYREQDLINVFNGLSGASERAQRDKAALERTLRELRSSNSRREAALGEAQRNLDTYSILAGLVPVTGPGVRITITETSGRVSIDTMVDLIQELRNAGAEAIEVNNTERVIAQTAIEPTVAGLTVGGKEVTPPYVITVVGDPTTLREGVSFLRGPLDQMRADGVGVDLQELGAVNITAVRQPVKPQYAQPE